MTGELLLSTYRFKCICTQGKRFVWYMESFDNISLPLFLQELHSTLLRTVPPYSEQAEVWANLVRSFKWSKVNLVCSNDYDHRLMFIKFTALAYQSSITVSILRLIMLSECRKTIIVQIGFFIAIILAICI